MCGRFSLATPYEVLQQHFQLTQGASFVPRYNIAPTQRIPVQVKPGAIDFLQWGFLAAWATDFTIQKPFINARAETILEKPMFRQAFMKRRCLILADGYYEWKTVGRAKQPFYIRRKDKGVFAMGGIWEGDTCAILTTKANSLIETVHERMPVILPQENYAAWLNKKADLKEISSLLGSLTLSTAWTLYPVTLQVNRPDFDTALCIHSLQ